MRTNMPELPEVDITCQGIRPYVVGHTIENIQINKRSLRYPIPLEFEKNCLKKEVTSVERRAKYILVVFSAGDGILIHLGMSGSLRILERAAPYRKHDHIEIKFNNVALRYNDPRRFGFVLYEKNFEDNRLLSRLGVEPLTDELSGQYLFHCTRSRRIAIKSLIMDQKVVVGVGNIYACEVLFLSKINPMRPANEINLDEFVTIVKYIKYILRKAMKQGGTTLKDFKNEHGNPGYFQQELLVYGRKGKACTQCGDVLLGSVIAQRSTVYCLNCQSR
jgi:formamidopyrimidine-DNA glycosylase